MYNSSLTAGARLREQRKLKGWSLERFAAIVGYSKSYVSMIERGISRGSLDFFWKCSDVLDIHIKELVPDISEDSRHQMEDWLMEIHRASPKKKEAIKRIWEQMKQHGISS